jgi:hypothetical protein
VEFENRAWRFASPDGDWRKSNAASRAIRVEWGKAVEKMRGRAKLMRNERIVGEQSRTASMH